MPRRLLSLGSVFSVAFLLLLLAQPRLTRAAVPAEIQGLHVSGNKILNGLNQQIRLLGVNRAGGEYMCIQGRGIWDGPADAASIQAIASWATNAIRIPLNEDCWLGINGVDPSMGGATYRQAVIDYVNLMNSYGQIAILDLHWTAPGTTKADKQTPMPNMDHTPAFWESVANTFKNNSSVIFDVFNEPYPDSNSDTIAGWTCWRDGGTCAGISYTVAGMQTLVTTIRNTGATNLIMLGGLQYSNALSNWLTYKPADPLNGLIASWHSYNFNLCANVVCWNQKVLPVIQQVPLIAGEIGENDCAHGYIDGLMNWLDSNNTSYLAWTWDAWGADLCGQGPVLINDYAGTPNAYGQGFKDHLLALKQQWTPTPTNTWTPGGPTITPSKTFTPTFTPTATFTPAAGALRVQVRNNGTDSTQETNFFIKTINTTASPLSGVSFRLFYTPDFGIAANAYVVDRYNEYINGVSSPAATITGPTLSSGTTYYYTFTFSGSSLAAGAAWELSGRIRLTDWSLNNIASNDWYHSIFPAAYADTIYIPAYTGSTLAWGLEPNGNGGGGATHTPSLTPSTTATVIIPTNTRTNTPTATVTNTVATFQPPTNTATRTTTVLPSSTPTRTNTALLTNTPTRTNTPTVTPLVTTPPPGNLRVQIQNGGTDSTQQSQFRFNVVNSGSTTLANLSVRLYLTTDGAQPISKYVVEKYWDQSGVVTISGPTLVAGNLYYYTFSYGTTTLAAGASWQYQGALHLNDWSNNFDAGNDWWHTDYTVGALPAAYLNTNYIPAYVGGTLVWGSTP